MGAERNPKKRDGSSASFLVFFRGSDRILPRVSLLEEFQGNELSCSKRQERICHGAEDLREVVVMLTDARFLEVYELLDKGMSEGDCGEPCARFCCTGVAVKTLLPGEEALFAAYHPEVKLARGPTGLRVVQSDGCFCVREHRLFVCRAFPFRPVLDRDTGAVVDLAKVDNDTFAPCWITEPLADWRERALRAWSIVLEDPDNRRFYSRIVYLRNFLEFVGDQFYSVPEERIDLFLDEVIGTMTPDQERILWLLQFPGSA